VANEKAIGPAIILESCRWIVSGLTKSLVTSSNAAVAQLAAGDGLIFGPGYSKQEAPRQKCRLDDAAKGLN